MIVSVLYRREADTWMASSPEIPRWIAAADTFEEIQELAEEGVRFALEEDFGRDELGLHDGEPVELRHYLPLER